MSKFKAGDIISPREYYPGFHKITVIRQDKDSYLCKIINGTVTIPIKTVEENYELFKQK